MCQEILLGVSRHVWMVAPVASPSFPDSCLPQEIIDIYEYRIQGLQPHTSSALEHPFYDISAAAVTAPGPLPSPLRPTHLSSLCSRMARLVIVDQAYKGLSTPDALHLARGLLGQVTGELSARPGDLTIINIEQLLVRIMGGHMSGAA